MGDKKKVISDSPAPPFAGSPIVRVGMGEGVVTRAAGIISSLGLGSCVVVTLYDAQQRIGGLAHIMLPDSSQMPMGNDDCEMRNNNPESEIRNRRYHCADTAIVALLDELCGKGATRRNIVAKMVGGARMFPDYNDGSRGIGEQNIMSIKHVLRRECISLIGEDVGGHHGRTVKFRLDSGKLIVKAIGKEDKEI